MADTWFKCEPTQFLLGMNRLETPEQALVYVVVCFRIYEAGGPVPNDPLTYMSATRMGSRKVRKAIDELVEAGKLFLVEGELMNPRAASELAARAALSTTRSKAGKAGGRPAKSQRTDGEPAANAQKSDENSPKTSRSLSVGGEEMAENSHSEKPNAFYARGREEKIREESPLPPSKSSAERLRAEWDLPDLDQPLEPAERVAAVERIASVSDRSDGDGQEVDIPNLISWIMRESRMVSPPIDMALATGWVRMGIDVDRIIRPTVARLAANARDGVKSFRYFDKTIREVFEAEKASRDDNVAYFRKIARQHAG